MDTTHTVVIKKQNHGLNFLIGLIALGLVIFWFLSGSAFQLASAYSSPVGDGVGSVTAVMVPMVYQLIGAIGVFVIAVASGIWAVVWDIVSGFWQMSKERAAIDRVEGSATRSAQASATETGYGQAGSSAVRVTPAMAVRRLNERLKRVEDELFPPPPPPPTPAELQAKIDNLEKQVTSRNQL